VYHEVSECTFFLGGSDVCGKFREASKERNVSVAIVHNNYIVGHDKKMKRFLDAGPMVVLEQSLRPMILTLEHGGHLGLRGCTWDWRESQFRSWV